MYLFCVSVSLSYQFLSLCVLEMRKALMETNMAIGICNYICIR